MTGTGPPRDPFVPSIRVLGDAAVLIELGDSVDLEVNRRVLALAGQIRAATAGQPGWDAPVPGACSLLVPVDPLEPGATAAAVRLRAILDAAPAAPAGNDGALPGDSGSAEDSGPIVEIPTHYNGPDLATIAEMTGLTRDEVIARHSAVEYTTLFLGFVPGFGYLGPLPTELVLPRRPVPRTQVPAGSVAIAGPQTAIYPIDSPGGWWLIGRTDLVLWDPRREPPALLAAGRRVRFVPATDRS